MNRQISNDWRILKDYLMSFAILEAEEIDMLQHLVKPKVLEEGDFFIQQDKVCKEVAFITSGIFRSYYYSSTGEQVTYCFTFSNSFITAYSSFISQTPTNENIQALTNASLLSIPGVAIKQLESSSINWLKFFKLMAEQEYIKMEDRIFQLQKESAEQRYKHLLENHPDYLQEIPLQHISSYLGITQRHLSRIRKAITN